MYDYKNVQSRSLTYRPTRNMVKSLSHQSTDCKSSHPSNQAQCLQPPCASGLATGKPSLSQIIVPIRPDGIPKISKQTAFPSAGIAALTSPLSSSMKPKITTKSPVRYQISKAPEKYLIPDKNALLTRTPSSIASSVPGLSYAQKPQSSTASSLRSFQPSIQSSVPPSSAASTSAPYLATSITKYPSSTISPTSDGTLESAYYYNYAISDSPSIGTLPTSLVSVAPLMPPTNSIPSSQPIVASLAPDVTQSVSPTVKIATLASQKSNKPSQRSETPEVLSPPVVLIPVAKISSFPDVIMRPTIGPEVILSPTVNLGATEPKSQNRKSQTSPKFMLPSSPSLYISQFPQNAIFFTQGPLTQPLSMPPSRNKPGSATFTTFSSVPQISQRVSTTPLSYILNSKSPSLVNQPSKTYSIKPVAVVTTSPMQNAQKSSILPSKSLRANQDGQVGLKAPSSVQSLFNFVPSKSAAPSIKQKSPNSYSGGGGYLRTNHDPI